MMMNAVNVMHIFRGEVSTKHILNQLTEVVCTTIMNLLSEFICM